MPRVPISEKCNKCLSSREFHNEACPIGCPEGYKIEAAFTLCRRVDREFSCRHINACQSNPLTCGYWTDLEYPVVFAEDCNSDECEMCQAEDACIAAGVIN